MTKELKEALDSLKLAIENFNNGNVTNEEEFITGLKPAIKIISEELEKPQGVPEVKQ